MSHNNLKLLLILLPSLLLSATVYFQGQRVMTFGKSQQNPTWLTLQESKYLAVKRHIQKVCADLKLTSQNLSKIRGRQLMLDKKHKIAYCRNAKVSFLFCFILRARALYDEWLSFLSALFSGGNFDLDETF